MAKKKLLAVLLAICMVLALAPAGVFTAFADGENILSLGCNKVIAEAPDENDDMVFTDYYFTPSESGDYWICSVSAGDPCCNISGGENNIELDDYDYNNYTMHDFREKVALTENVTYTFSVSQYEYEFLEFDLFITTEDNFSITCEDDENGCIFAPLFADENTPVSFVPVSYDNMWTANDIKVTYTDPEHGETEIAYVLSGGIYSFIMPSADVTVSCAFEAPGPDDATALSLGENELSVPDGQFGFYSFTAEDAGTYEFASHASDGDPRATLYNSNQLELVSDDDYLGTPDFRIVRSLEAGETVYLSVSEYSNDSIYGTLTVTPIEPVSFVSHGLVLTGEIGVVFYTEILDPVDFDSSYVEFLIGKSGKQISPLDEVEYNDDYEGYALTCYVGSYRMADKITPTVHWFENGVEKTVTFEPYSANDYINYALDNPYDFSGESLALVEALADLGTCAQEYLSGLHGYTVGDGENDKYAQFAVNRVVDAYEYDSIMPEVGAFYDYSMDFSADKIENATFSLNLESSTALYIYLTVKDGVSLDSALLMLDDENTEEIEMTQRSENVYRIAARNIKASELGDVYRIKVTDSEGESIGTCYLTPLTYVAKVLDLYSMDASKAPLCDTVCAIYRYYYAAKVLADIYSGNLVP